MPSWWDSLFGDVPPPARPTSRGAMLGMNYQAMPNAQSVEDRRPEGEDYTVGMRKSRGDWTKNYWPTDIKGADPWAAGIFRGGYDPLVAAPLIAQGRHAPGPGDYGPSFPPNLPPLRKPVAAPNLPPPRSNPDPGLPYIGAHLPWSPGDPGWTPPPPPTVLPTRPDARGLTLNSSPWGF